MKKITKSKFYLNNFIIEIDNNETFYFDVPERNFYSEKEWIEQIEEAVGKINWENSNGLLVNISNYYGLLTE